MTAAPVRTVFLGSGGFGRESLRRLVEHREVDVVGVVTAPPRPTGRRRSVRVTEIHAEADALGVGSILTPERLRDPEAVAAVLALEPGLLVLSDYGQLVPSALLDVQHGALNLHPSLLPRHRGATPIPAAILAGDRETGVTLMRMDAGLDTGPIVAQTHVDLTGTETTPDLEARLATVGAELLDRSVGPWISGQMAARPQSGDGATLTRQLGRQDGRLDPTQTAAYLERQVRAFQPWPGSFVDTVVGRLIVLTTSVGPAAEADPGRITDVGLDTVDDRLLFGEVRPAGRNAMPWAAFLRGHPSIIGTKVLPAR